LFLSVLNARSGVPLIPANVTTPGVPETGLIAVGSNEFSLLLISRRGNSASQRKPALMVRRSVIRQSSLCIESQVGSTSLDLVRDLDARRVNLSEKEAGQRVSSARNSGQARDERTDYKIACRASVANLIVGSGAIFSTELPGVLAL
jgi:hypothetical protein